MARTRTEKLALGCAAGGLLGLLAGFHATWVTTRVASVEQTRAGVASLQPVDYHLGVTLIPGLDGQVTLLGLLALAAIALAPRRYGTVVLSSLAGVATLWWVSMPVLTAEGLFFQGRVIEHVSLGDPPKGNELTAVIAGPDGPTLAVAKLEPGFALPVVGCLAFLLAGFLLRTVWLKRHVPAAGGFQNPPAT